MVHDLSVNIIRKYDPEKDKVHYFCQLVHSLQPFEQLNDDLRRNTFSSFSEAKWYGRELYYKVWAVKPSFFRGGMTTPSFHLKRFTERLQVLC